MFFGKKTVGICFDKKGIRAVLVSGGGVLDSWKNELALDLNAPDSLKDGLTSALSGSGFKVKTAAVSIPDTLARTGVFEFEELPQGQKDVLGIVKAKASKSFNVDVGEYVLDFQVFDAEKSKKVLCVAVRKDIIVSIHEALALSGIRLLKTSIHSLNCVNTLAGGDEDAAVIVRVSDFLTVMVFRKGAPDFYRCKTVEGREDECLNDILSSFAYYLGRNPGFSLNKVYLMDETEVLKEVLKDKIPASLELVRPEKLISGQNSNDLGMLSAVGSCI